MTTPSNCHLGTLEHFSGPILPFPEKKQIPIWLLWFISGTPRKENAQMGVPFFYQNDLFIIHVFHKWICSMQSCLWKFSLSWWKKSDELLKSGIVDYTSLRLFLFNLAKIPRGYDWSQKDKNELCWESINQGWYKRCD